MNKGFLAVFLLAGMFFVHGIQAVETREGPDGEALVNERCALCHDLVRVNRAMVSKDRAGWERTVDRMIGKRAGLLDEVEREAVLEHLTRK